MPGTYEIAQATGALTQMMLAKESDWGVASPSQNYHRMNIVPGESLDINLAVYESRVIRGDRMANKSVRGTQRPGGVIPQELAPRGQAGLLYGLLGWHVTTASLGGGLYSHILRGANDISLLPSFTIEKGFLDPDLNGGSPQYQAWLGSRVNGVTVDFNVDSQALCNFDILSRECTDFSPASIVQGTPTEHLIDPFTSVQITLYEGASSGSLDAIGSCSQLQLAVTNNMYANNFVLGSNYRANLKAGTRRVSFNGVFLFNDVRLYNKAIDGDDTIIQITLDDGTYSHDILLPNVDLYPNGISPKISTDGPLTLNMMGMSTKHATMETDIQWTIVNNQSSIVA